MKKLFLALFPAAKYSGKNRMFYFGWENQQRQISYQVVSDIFAQVRNSYCSSAILGKSQKA